MNRIRKTFDKLNKENKKALGIFVTAGDPDFESSLKLITNLPDNGADFIEIGMPFSDPMADGPSIQLSSQRALKSGMNIKKCLSIIKIFREKNIHTPIILMGYFNPIYKFGKEKFIKKCKEVGVDGLIVVDLSYPDNIKFSRLCKKNSICFVQLIAPTTSIKRMKDILRISDSTIYMISMISTTGSALKVTTRKIMKNYEIIKQLSPLKNVIIGFGITEKTIGKLKSANGLVVGSAICKEITRSLKSRQNPVINVVKLVSKLKKKII